MENNLKEIMYFLRITQAELSERANISRQVISALCNKRASANPRYQTMLEISRALGFSIYDTFFNEQIESVLYERRNQRKKQRAKKKSNNK